MSIARWLCFTALLLICNTTSAQLQTYTNSADFDAAVGLVVVEDFESSPLGELNAGANDVGMFDVFLDAADTDGTSRVADFGLVNGSRELQLDLDNDHNTVIRFDFDQPIFGFGADFGAALTGDFLTLEVNGNLFALNDFLATSGDGFFGISSEQSFESITFGRESATSFGKFFAVDNVRLSAVPEPGSGLVAIVFGVIAASRRSRNRQCCSKV